MCQSYAGSRQQVGAQAGRELLQELQVEERGVSW